MKNDRNYELMEFHPRRYALVWAIVIAGLFVLFSCLAGSADTALRIMMGAM